MATRPFPHSAPAWALNLLLAIAVALVSPPVAGQQRGQWWWDASLSANTRSTRTDAGGASQESKDSELRLFSALNGYLGDPILGDFRLELDLSVNEANNGHRLATDRTGYAAIFNVLPRSSLPTRFTFRRRLFDYSGPISDDPLSALRLPTAGTFLDAQVHAARGPLRGLTLSASDQRLEMGGQVSDDTGTRLVDWGRSIDGTRLHARVEQRTRDYESSAFSSDELRYRLEAFSHLSDLWEQNTQGFGATREWRHGASPSTSSSSYSLTSRLTRRSPRGTQLGFRGYLRHLASDQFSTVDGYGLSVDHIWNLAGGWTIAPFVSYDARDSEDVSVAGVGAGTSVSSIWRRRAFEVSSRIRAAFRRIESEENLMDRADTQASWNATVALRHAVAAGLDKELEVSVARNDFDSLLAPRTGFPDQDLIDRAFVRTIDRVSVRARLSRTVGGHGLSGWLDASRSRDAESGNGSLQLDQLQGSFGWNAGRFDVSANVGRSSLRHTVAEGQEVVHLGAQAHCRATRYLTIDGFLRHDRRDLDVSLDIDATTLQAGGTLHIGLLDLSLRYYETREVYHGAPGRTRDGYSLSISRRFAGWLPIVTGVQRRGTIR